MKTTLQKLIEAIKKREVEVYHTTKEGIVISRLDEFLEMEKNQLIEAHSEGIKFMAENLTIPQPALMSWFSSKYDVGGSVSITAVVPLRFAVQIKNLHKKHNIELLSEKGLNEDFVELTVQGEMENLKLLNDEAGIAAYGMVLVRD